MKKNKGFTLIELLAIIVILAIIAVITVPIILNIIDNSRKGAAVDSAYGFKDAVHTAYVDKLSAYNDLKLNGTYTVGSNGTLSGDFNDSEVTSLTITVSGTIPSSGSLTYDNNVLTEGWLVIGDYKVEFNSGGTVTATKNTSSSSNEQSSGSGNSTPSNPYLTRFDGNYTYYVFGLISENPTGYDFDFANYEEPDNNNQCPEYYAYYAGDNEHNADCYYINTGYCDNGNYNFETGKCEDYGATEIQDVSDKVFYLRNDGTTYETCGVFGSGQAGTVCLTSPYYNSNYNSYDNNSSDDNYYRKDFEDVTDYTYDITTTSGLTATGLKGYSLTKAQEMLSKGASSCFVSMFVVYCDIPSDDYYCSIESEGTVYCGGPDNYDGCDVNHNGIYQCYDD